jgi:hypothetical protein
MESNLNLLRRRWKSLGRNSQGKTELERGREETKVEEERVAGIGGGEGGVSWTSSTTRRRMKIKGSVQIIFLSSRKKFGGLIMLKFTQSLNTLLMRRTLKNSNVADNLMKKYSKIIVFNTNYTDSSLYLSTIDMVSTRYTALKISLLK